MVSRTNGQRANRVLRADGCKHGREPCKNERDVGMHACVAGCFRVPGHQAGCSRGWASPHAPFAFRSVQTAAELQCACDQNCTTRGWLYLGLFWPITRRVMDRRYFWNGPPPDGHNTAKAVIGRTRTISSLSHDRPFSRQGSPSRPRTTRECRSKPEGLRTLSSGCMQICGSLSMLSKVAHSVLCGL